jgi:hypothetical protein
MDNGLVSKGLSRNLHSMPLSAYTLRRQHEQRTLIRIPHSLEAIDQLLALASRRESRPPPFTPHPPSSDIEFRRAEYHVAMLFHRRFLRLRREGGNYRFVPQALTRGMFSAGFGA